MVEFETRTMLQYREIDKTHNPVFIELLNHPMFSKNDLTTSFSAILESENLIYSELITKMEIPEVKNLKKESKKISRPY